MPYTPENNPYIPGDPYSYDLKWMVKELKHAISLYEPLSAEFKELYDYVHDYFEGSDFAQLVDQALRVLASDGTLEALIRPLFDEYKIEIDDDLANFKASMSEIMVDQNARIRVLENRMDSFASLEEGSTTADAELMDIRVGWDGKEWPSAGDAVRGQVTEIHDQLDAMSAEVFNYDNVAWKGNTSYPTGWKTGYWGGTTGEQLQSFSSNYYMRAHFAIYSSKYPEMIGSRFMLITPPATYGIRVLEFDSDDMITASFGQMAVDLYPEAAGAPVLVPLTAGRNYAVSMGKFTDSSEYVDDQDFVDTITLQFLSSNYIENPYKTKTGDYEFFTVEVPRPLCFGNEEQISDTDVVECVLRLPDSYSRLGEPTRLVLMCHGSSGYVDSANDTWYNASWKSLCNDILAEGYALFDANVLPTSTGTSQMGFAMGSPLYVNVLKAAYDYIINNYNVTKQIFAHGCSMGGLGAAAFTHAYPELVLAESSFAGRDIIKYIENLESGTVDYLERFAIAWGYASYADLMADEFGHVNGTFDSLSLLKLNNGAIEPTPIRATEYADWLAYFSQLAELARDADAGIWIGKRTVPFITWNSWADTVADTKLAEVLAEAYQRGNSCPYYAIAYESGTHTEMTYGQINNLRDQLICWFKRWS